MKKITNILSAIIILLTFSPVNIFAAENIANTSENIEVSMWDSSGKVYMDYDNILYSDYSYCIEAPQRNDIRIKKCFEVEKDKYYTVSAYFKTENVINTENSDIGANISFGDWNLSQSLVGDNNWTKISMMVYSGNKSEIELSFNLGYWSNTCTGKVYITDINLNEIIPQKNTDWKFLFVILKNNNIRFKDANGTIKYENNTMTTAEIDIINKMASQFETDLYLDSNGLIIPTVDVITVEKPISELTSESGSGLWLTPDEAYDFIKDSVNIDLYDHVTVFANLNTIKTTYFGLGGSCFSQNTGYSFINTQNRDYCLTIFDNKRFWSPAGVTHEFLHFMETWSKKLNKQISVSLHDAEKYGYTDDNDWREWYTDFINNSIKNEKNGGINEIVWGLPPRTFRSNSENEGVYIASGEYTVNSSTVKVDATITNNFSESKNANIYIAFYKQGKLVDLKSEFITLTAGSSQIISKETATNTKADTAKIFVWKSTKSVFPYTEAAVLNITYP